MFASPAISSAAVPVLSSPLRGTERAKRPVPRVGGLRSIGEILPLVMAQYDESQEPALASRDLVIAVRLSPNETPRSSVLEYLSQTSTPGCEAYCLC
jgi:hypothetical protein